MVYSIILEKAAKLSGGLVMSGLNEDEIRTLAKSVNLDIKNSDITDVAHSLNAMLEAIAQINPEGINSVEPLPIILNKRD